MTVSMVVSMLPMQQEVLPLLESPKLLGHPLGHGTYLIITSIQPQSANNKKHIDKKCSVTLVQHYGDNHYNFTRSLDIL